MNKTAIKNFAVWARRKLMDDVTLKARSLGITADGIVTKNEKKSTKEVHFFNIGTGEDVGFSGTVLRQRTSLVHHIENKTRTTNHETAFHSVIEEVAYTWFNRLISIRFMEVNGYLPSGVRVLSSSMTGKKEPDMVSRPFETDLEFSTEEREKVEQMLDKGESDPLFSLLFIKQCNALNAVLPKLFEETHDYTELLLNVSYIKEDGVISRLVTDISEDDFRNQVEIVGWLYQYYNTEPKEKVINIYKGTIKKEDIPAATQLFTTDWVVRYMVDNSLGRYWMERNPENSVEQFLTFYLNSKNESTSTKLESVLPENLTFFDPCMGSAHILVYAFDVLMKIYQSLGCKTRKAVKNIVENNIYGLDIDKRAYQLAYFAIMMKATQYDDHFLTRNITPMVYCPVNHAELEHYGSLLRVKDLPKEPDSEIERSLFDIPYEEELQNWNFLHLLTKKYTIVATNPPYLNKMNPDMKKYMSGHYKEVSADLFSIFMYRNFDFCEENGYSAFMTPFVWMFIKTYEKLRTEILENKSISSLIQMEYSAFEEATVPICSFVLKNGKETNHGLYIRLSDFRGGMEVQKKKVLEALTNKECGYFFEAQQENFSKIPGSPIAYWVSEKSFILCEESELFEVYATTRAGMITGNNHVFVRLWHEVSKDLTLTNASSRTEAAESKKRWFPYNKGGAFRKWFGNNEYLVNWENDGEKMRNFKDSKGNIPAHAFNLDYIFKENVTWSSLSSYKFAARYTDFGFLYDASGSFADVEKEHINYTLALLCSAVTFYFLSAVNPTLNFQKGNISTLPFIFSPTHKPTIDTLVEQNISLSKTDWDSFETSWDFKKHPLLQGNRVQSAYNQWETECQTRFDTLKSNEEELNRLFFEIYGLQEELTPEVEDKDVTVRLADLQREVKSLISYGIGCLFGRYSLDCEGLAYAGGEWDSDKYQTLQPVAKNYLVICHEDYQGQDLTSLFIHFLKKAYGEDTLSDNLDFMVKALGTKGDSPEECLTSYFMKDFYKDHLKIYQKRPIYWLYDSGKESGFKALMYIQRYNQDTTGQIRTDFLHPLQTVYQEMLKSLDFRIQEGGSSGKLNKEKEKLTKKLEETRKYDEKLSHLANMRIDLDLDDGVKVNYEKLQTGSDGKKIDILGKI